MEYLEEEKFIKSIEQLCIQSNWDAFNKGWHEEKRNDGEMIALMHSELSEALEGIRHGNGPSDHIPSFNCAEEEMADVVIRIADMCCLRGWRLGEAIVEKMKYNKTREKKHGKLF